MLLFYVKYLVFLLFLINSIVHEAHGRTWDLAVTIGREINFFSSNGTMTGRVKNHEAIDLTTIAYDDEIRVMYLGDNKNKNITIFSKYLDVKSNKWNSLLDHNTMTVQHIMGMIYDRVSSSLFYTDAKSSAIMRIETNETIDTVTDNTPRDPEIILKLPGQSVRGISMDFCSRRIYWTNSNISNPSIESSDIHGNDRKIIINTNLYEPVTVAVDHITGKLYWIDDEEGIHYKIERSNLDGSKRELLFHGKHQQPVHIAVDNDAIYWTDWAYSAVWRMNKTVEPGDAPEKWQSFFDSNRDAEPTGLIARDNLGHIDCISIERMRRVEGEETVMGESDRYEGLITSTEDVGNEKEKMFCLNGGSLKEMNTSCSCKNGYDGHYCETSLCHNYCVHGECTVSSDGKAHCKCSSMYRGQRCEQNICTGFCLNEGQCTIKNGEPFCTCRKSRGVRCEDTTDFHQVCAVLCSSNYEKFGSYNRTICRCTDGNSTDNSIYDIYTDPVINKTLLIAFIVIISVLTMITLVLSYYVNKFRRRPRIKKRFVVSKNGITPLTSRPQLPSDQCEIMIENCCNMNICETPCFEPKLRNSEPRLSKKEEKNSLLDSMDGNNSC